MSLQNAPVDSLPLFQPPEEPEPPVAPEPEPAPEPESNPELEAKEEVLEEHERTSSEWLEELRVRIRKVYHTQVLLVGEEHAYVCADDARRIIREEGLKPPAGTSMNALGALFKPREWAVQSDEDHISTTKGSHGNPLTRWKWVGEA